MRLPRNLPSLLRRSDLVASWNPARPLAANLLFVGFVVVLELFGREEAIAAGASLQPPLLLAVIFAGLWLAYPFALHVKLPLVAETSEAGRQGRLAEGWEAGLLVGGLLMSVLTILVAITSLGFDLDHPLAFLWLLAATGHGLAVAFLYLDHLGTPPGHLAWRRRWEWVADLVLVSYLCLAYAWIWEGMVTGRTPNLASYAWPAVLPQLLAAVMLFWIVYFPLQAPFLLGLAGSLEARRGGVWLFRASCIAATVVGLWPCFQVTPFAADAPLPRERLASQEVTAHSVHRALKEPQRVRRLVLRRKLRRVPRAVSRLVNLQILDLSHNRLETVPRRLRALENLQELELSFNRLAPRGLAPLAGLELRRLAVAFNPELDVAALPAQFPQLVLLMVDPEQLRALPSPASTHVRLAVHLPHGMTYRGAAWSRGPGATSVDEREWVSDLAVEATEVTVRHYSECVAAGNCTPTAAGGHCTGHLPGHERHPINCVTFEQAQVYCQWLGGALPATSQWEYAARGRGQPYPWGEEAPGDSRLGNFADEALARLDPSLRARILVGYDDGAATTAPVGSFPAGASPFGLLDMAGNVGEWVVDPGGGAGIRGGSWAGPMHTLDPNAAFLMDAQDHASQWPEVGFRCAFPGWIAEPSRGATSTTQPERPGRAR